MNSLTRMIILLALATPIVAHASDKKPEEQKSQRPQLCTLICMFYHRLSALRLGTEASWIARDLQQIPQTVRNRLQDCRRRITSE